MFDYLSHVISDNASTGLRILTPSNLWRPLTIHWNEVFTWTCSIITGFFFLVRTTTCLSTILSSFDYSPCSFLHSFSTRLGTFWPFTPGRLLTIHFGCFTGFATIPFHPGCVISSATVSSINQLPAVTFFILTWFWTSIFFLATLTYATCFPAVLWHKWFCKCLAT